MFNVLSIGYTDSRFGSSEGLVTMLSVLVVFFIGGANFVKYASHFKLRYLFGS
jgi:hypothetical protein